MVSVLFVSIAEPNEGWICGTGWFHKFIKPMFVSKLNLRSKAAFRSALTNQILNNSPV